MKGLRKSALIVTLIAVAFFVFTPTGAYLVWRARIGQQIGRSEAQVVGTFDEPHKKLLPGDNPARYRHYAPLEGRPLSQPVLVYGFMNVRALLMLREDGTVSEVKYVNLLTQVLDNDFP